MDDYTYYKKIIFGIPKNSDCSKCNNTFEYEDRNGYAVGICRIFNCEVYNRYIWNAKSSPDCKKMLEDSEKIFYVNSDGIACDENELIKAVNNE